MVDHNPKITEEIEEIIHLTQDIIVKLGLDIPLGEDLSFLQQSQFYFEIFKIIFNSDDFLEDLDEETSANKIQRLLDFLANDVLFVNLEHINGEEISNGNIAHIKNFLQLIWALINVEETTGEGYREEVNMEMNEVFETDRDEDGNIRDINEVESRVSKELIDKIDFDILEYEDSFKDQSENKVRSAIKARKGTKKTTKTSMVKSKVNNLTEPDLEPRKPKRKQKTVDLTKKQDKVFKKKKTIEKEDYQDGNVFIKPKFAKTKQTATSNPVASMKPVVVNHIERNLYSNGQHRYLKKEGGTLKESLPAMISSKTLKGLEEYLDPQPASVTRLKDTVIKHKKEYHKCLTDFVSFLSKNNDKSRFRGIDVKSLTKKERTIRAFEKKLQEDIQNEEASNYYKMRDEVARYVKRM